MHRLLGGLSQGLVSQGLAGLWVGSVVFGWWPNAWLIEGQWWWWLAGSLVVVAVSLCQVRQWEFREAGWVLGLLLIGTLGWHHRMPGTPVWLAQLVLCLLAGALLVERWGWNVLKRAVIWAAWLQVPVIVLQYFGWDAYPHVWGTTGRRAVLGSLFGMASLWSNHWRAWVLAIMSLMTGSFTGWVIPLIRLLPINWRAPLPYVALITLGLLSWRAWGLSLIERLDTWRHLGWWTTHWLSGWGLQELPTGFAEVVQIATGTPVQGPVFLNSTWLDVLARGGLIGLACLVALMGWAARRSLATKTWWSFLLACWVMTWQSVAAQPILLMLGFVWLLSLVNARRVHADPI